MFIFAPILFIILINPGKLVFIVSASSIEIGLLDIKPKSHMEVSLNTVKIYLQYRNGVYVGSMSGMEFTIEEGDLTKEHQEYHR